ncbi:uncharacterized protein MONOS_3857 [Monocercomonoides exilis]|uniref:uncharacterized protein n=1 Tax=Monocercomonoides exilis TaxID=2049356 RepID=UPI003559CA07|nr:hypothetical protein MONOS_3857 [Monocercomonoides exilis]|eukprot:MONOS_3857.1-p1 / transcript=MONOS_3857.1 / gene=MONOS_3857 / organism=Monocercomonoides_exilis_PA203 / gene_product=unspecified product / transcript_product=unspecified product / location=Mono_scaffold00095:26159-30258(-) / protein_length=1186 / sequence_SO=supercontig / SO=protein_coding / is_pseudo=false
MIILHFVAYILFGIVSCYDERKLIDEYTDKYFNFIELLPRDNSTECFAITNNRFDECKNILESTCPRECLSSPNYTLCIKQCREEELSVCGNNLVHQKEICIFHIISNCRNSYLKCVDKSKFRCSRLPEDESSQCLMDSVAKCGLDYSNCVRSVPPNEEFSSQCSRTCKIILDRCESSLIQTCLHKCPSNNTTSSFGKNAATDNQMDGIDGECLMNCINKDADLCYVPYVECINGCSSNSRLSNSTNAANDTYDSSLKRTMAFHSNQHLTQDASISETCRYECEGNHDECVTACDDKCFTICAVYKGSNGSYEASEDCVKCLSRCIRECIPQEEECVNRCIERKQHDESLSLCSEECQKATRISTQTASQHCARMCRGAYYLDSCMGLCMSEQMDPITEQNDKCREDCRAAFAKESYQLDVTNGKEEGKKEEGKEGKEQKYAEPEEGRKRCLDECNITLRDCSEELRNFCASECQSSSSKKEEGIKCISDCLSSNMHQCVDSFADCVGVCADAFSPSAASTFNSPSFSASPSKKMNWADKRNDNYDFDVEPDSFQQQQQQEQETKSFLNSQIPLEELNVRLKQTQTGEKQPNQNQFASSNEHFSRDFQSASTNSEDRKANPIGEQENEVELSETEKCIDEAMEDYLRCQNDALEQCKSMQKMNSPFRGNRNANGEAYEEEEEKDEEENENYHSCLDAMLSQCSSYNFRLTGMCMGKFLQKEHESADQPADDEAQEEAMNSASSPSSPSSSASASASSYSPLSNPPQSLRAIRQEMNKCNDRCDVKGDKCLGECARQKKRMMLKLSLSNGTAQPSDSQTAGGTQFERGADGYASVVFQQRSSALAEQTGRSCADVCEDEWLSCTNVCADAATQKMKQLKRSALANESDPVLSHSAKDSIDDDSSSFMPPQSMFGEDGMQQMMMMMQMMQMMQMAQSMAMNPPFDTSQFNSSSTATASSSSSFDSSNDTFTPPFSDMPNDFMMTQFFFFADDQPPFGINPFGEHFGQSIPNFFGETSQNENYGSTIPDEDDENDPKYDDCGTQNDRNENYTANDESSDAIESCLKEKKECEADCRGLKQRCVMRLRNEGRPTEEVYRHCANVEEECQSECEDAFSSCTNTAPASHSKKRAFHRPGIAESVLGKRQTRAIRRQSTARNQMFDRAESEGHPSDNDRSREEMMYFAQPRR